MYGDRLPLHLAVNDASIQKPITIDAVHEHGWLTFLFGFNDQSVSNLTYLRSYILVVCGYVCVWILCVGSFVFV